VYNNEIFKKALFKFRQNFGLFTRKSHIEYGNAYSKSRFLYRFMSESRYTFRRDRLVRALINVVITCRITRPDRIRTRKLIKPRRRSSRSDARCIVIITTARAFIIVYTIAVINVRGKFALETAFPYNSVHLYEYIKICNKI